LVGGQDVDRERLSLGEDRKAHRCPGDANRDKRRIERNRGERVGREAAWRAVRFARRDDGDARRKDAERLSEGERIEEKAVLKVAMIDPLRVEVIVPAAYFSKIKTGMTATVKPEVSEAEPRGAKVIVVDRVIDAASNSFRVRLELPNPNHQLPPGLRCKVDFDLPAPAAETTKPKPRAAVATVPPK